MKNILIIPLADRLDESMELAKEYGFGFEYNDFFNPDILDMEEKKQDIINIYKSRHLPEYTTLHGAFFDVIVFSMDKKIRGVSRLRVEQSMKTAKEMGVKGVVFHTNYNPFLNSASYINGWMDANTVYWRDILEKYPDMEIYLENMFDVSPYPLAMLSERLARYSNYGVCFDYAHASISGTDMDEWVSALGRYVRHVHINDNDLKSDLHLAVGDGKIDWERFYRHYERMNGASVLIETSSVESQRRSAIRLEKDGFLIK